MDTGWCFAKINGRLAEIYFEEGKKLPLVFNAHCYIEKSEFKTKRELQQIERDIARNDLIFRKNEYKDRKTGKIIGKLHGFKKT